MPQRYLEKLNCPQLGISHFYEFSLRQGKSHEMKAVPDGSIDLLFNIGSDKVTTYISGTVFGVKAWNLGDADTCFGVRFQPGQGMAKMNMLPKIFSKTNKHNVPWFGQMFVSAAILIFGYFSDSSADMISFLILAGSVFWMISYILAHVDVLIFRKRLPNAPRNFKVPCGILFPVIGIVGTAYMILNISSDPQERMNIWLLTGACFIVLEIYSAVWIKFKMKMKVFKSIPLEKVMAMENELYYYVRKSKGIWK